MPEGAEGRVKRSLVKNTRVTRSFTRRNLVACCKPERRGCFMVEHSLVIEYFVEEGIAPRDRHCCCCCCIIAWRLALFALNATILAPAPPSFSPPRRCVSRLLAFTTRFSKQVTPSSRCFYSFFGPPTEEHNILQNDDGKTISIDEVVEDRN